MEKYGPKAVIGLVIVGRLTLKESGEIFRSDFLDMQKIDFEELKKQMEAGQFDPGKELDYVAAEGEKMSAVIGRPTMGKREFIKTIAMPAALVSIWSATASVGMADEKLNKHAEKEDKVPYPKLRNANRILNSTPAHLAEILLSAWIGMCMADDWKDHKQLWEAQTFTEVSNSMDAMARVLGIRSMDFEVDCRPAKRL